MKKSRLPGVVFACLLFSSFSSNATLLPNDVLEFSSNSYWALDINNDSSFTGTNEQAFITSNQGIVIGGDTQDAYGSHPGLPDGSETPEIDNPSVFLGNTGMHLTLSPITYHRS